MRKTLLLALLSAAALLASCGGSGASKESAAKPRVLCHRGLCSTGTEFTTDENTLDALRRAQEKGVDGVEFDVHLTADGELVIRHDAKIAPGLHTQKSNFDDIRAYTLPFGNKIPTLHEWLVQAKETPDILMFLEIKAMATQERENELVARCIEEVRSLGMSDQMYYLSFKPATCDEVLRLDPEARVLLNSSSLHHSLPPAEVAARGYSAASYSVEVFLNHPEWVKEFRELGIETFFWMVDSPYLRDIAEKLGVDWITTDFYDVIGYRKK